MAQKPVLRVEVGCACVAREVSAERGSMGERGCARRLVGENCGEKDSWESSVFNEVKGLLDKPGGPTRRMASTEADDKKR